MKLEVGKSYRTRGGEKVFIFHQYSRGEYNMHGCIVGTQDTGGWREDGAFNDEPKEPLDIISKWEEPVPEPKKKVYRLSEMWKVWFIEPVTFGEDWPKIESFIHYTLSEAIESKIMLNKEGYSVLAITRADATEFFEGEGL